jgi:hypothetical protein
VRFGFAQPKQLLDIYRLLCSGKPTVYTDLCKLFDVETKDGTEMVAYDLLLAKALASITATFQKRVTGGLQTARNFVIPTEQEQVNDRSDLELVTWLVIKANE